MDIGNPLKVVVDLVDLLIGRMTNLDHRDEFSIMSALMCTTTH